MAVLAVLAMWSVTACGPAARDVSLSSPTVASTPAAAQASSVSTPTVALAASEDEAGAPVPGLPSPTSAQDAPHADRLAAERCETHALAVAREMGEVESLVRSHPAAMGAFVGWEEQPHGDPDGPRHVSRWRGRPDDEFVSVCYIDGVFAGIPTGPPGVGPAFYTRIRMVVTGDDQVSLLQAGQSASMDADEAPPRTGAEEAAAGHGQASG